jgi:hypothetical protein
LIFSADRVTKDKITKYEIYPFSIIIEGDVQKIEKGMRKLQEIPYITKDVQN